MMSMMHSRMLATSTILTTIVFLLGMEPKQAFVLSPTAHGICVARFSEFTTSRKAVNLEAIADVSYSVSGSKPLGVVFGENPQPYSGMVVDNVQLDSNGLNVGLRVGDQLLAIDGQSVVGNDFETVMSMLRDAPDPMNLDLYRGTVRMLYTILENRNAIIEDHRPADDEEETILDENYESPVVVPVDDSVDYDAPLTTKEVFTAFKKIGGMMTDSVSASKAQGGKKEKGGLFGGMFGGDSIQLDGDDATSLK